MYCKQDIFRSFSVAIESRLESTDVLVSCETRDALSGETSRVDELPITIRIELTARKICGLEL